MKVAIVHDWLIAPAGAVKVLEQIVECFPDADLFSLADFLEDRGPLDGKPVTTSFIQRLLFAGRRCHAWLPLMGPAFGQFDLSSYDLIITSSHAAASGALARPDQTHVSYLHSATRHAWDLQHQTLREANLTRECRTFSPAVFRRAFMAEVTRTIAAAGRRNDRLSNYLPIGNVAICK